MKIDTILEEFDRLDFIEEDVDFREFYYTKLDEWDIDTPDCLDLENVHEFIEEITNEWIDDLNYDLVLESYNNIEADANINESFINEVRKIKITGHSSATDKKKAKVRRIKDKVKLKKKAKKKKRKQKSCGEGKVWSMKQNKCIKKAKQVGLKKRVRK